MSMFEYYDDDERHQRSRSDFTHGGDSETEEPTYRTFLRSATSFEEFAKAEKFPMNRGLSYDDARTQCQEFNDNRDQDQIATGEKMEFEKE